MTPENDTFGIEKSVALFKWVKQQAEIRQRLRMTPEQKAAAVSKTQITPAG